MSLIRTVLHDYRDLNSGKLVALQQALIQCFYAKQFFVNYYWNLYSESKDFETSKYFDYKVLSEKLKTELCPDITWRAVNSACDDATGILKSLFNKKRNLIRRLEKLKQENIKRSEQNLNIKSTEKLEVLLNNISDSKPWLSLEETSLEVSSKCLQFIYPFDPKLNTYDRQLENELSLACESLSLKPTPEKQAKLDKLKSERRFKHFDFFIKISILEGSPIYMPVKLNKQDQKFKKMKAKLLGGVELRMNSFDLRYEIEDSPIKTEGKVVGADSGVRSILTLSDGQSTKFNEAFQKCLLEMSKTEKGTKKFKRFQDQRKNIINRAINSLDLTNIKQINLEHISNLFFKNNVGAYLARFTNTLIEASLRSRCELEGVLLNLQSAAFRSQRCHACGLVKKNNRTKKDYECCNPHCKNHEMIFDADLNSALNHELELPMIPEFLFRSKQNFKGFFWLPEGVFNVGLDYEVGGKLENPMESNLNQKQDFIGDASASPNCKSDDL